MQTQFDHLNRRKKFPAHAFRLILMAIGFLCVGSRAAHCTPVVFNHSETANPGDVVYFQGAWGSSIQVSYELITGSAAPSTSSATALSVVTNNLGNQQVAGSYVSARIPTTATAGLYAVWLNDGSGWSSPIFLNQADATHCEFSQISPGFQFLVFGRNMMVSGSTPTVSFVDTTNSTSYPGTVNTSASSPYYLAVTLTASGFPSSAVGHAFNVVVSNGAGGVYGSEIYSAGSYAANSNIAQEGTTVSWPSGVAAPASTTNTGSHAYNLNVPWQADYDTICQNGLNAVVSYGVVAGGYTTDAAAKTNATNMQNCINAAAALGSGAGGYVYLPSGTYAFDYPSGTNTGIFNLPSNVVIIGDGPTSTILDFGYSAPPTNSENCLFRKSGTSNNGFLNLEFQNTNSYANNGEQAVTGWGSQLFFESCNFVMAAASGVDNDGPSNLLLQNCNMTFTGDIGSPFMFHGESQVVINSDTINYSAGRIWAAWGGGTQDVYVANNTFTRTANDTVSEENTGVFDLTGTHCVFNHNTFNVASGLTVNQDNDDEQILSEYGTGPGGINNTSASTTSTTITGNSGATTWPVATYSDALNSNDGTADNCPTIQITSGADNGDFRYVTATNGKTITVDHAWTTTPAGGDNFAIYPAIVGYSTSSTSTTLTDSAQNWPSGWYSGTADWNGTDWTNCPVVYILSGPDTGQWRHVIGNTGTTLTVDQPWSVAPAAGSRYQLGGWDSSDWLVYNNTFTNNLRGIILTNSSYNDLVANNTLTNNDGILFSCSQGTQNNGAGSNLAAPWPETVQVNWDNKAFANTIADPSGTGPEGYAPAYFSERMEIDNPYKYVIGTGILGLEARSNSLSVESPVNGLDGSSGNKEIPAQNYLNAVIQENDPSGGGLWPRPCATNAAHASGLTGVGILGSIFQNNYATGQGGTFNTYLPTTNTDPTTTTTLNASAYFFGSGNVCSVVADPELGKVSGSTYTFNGDQYTLYNPTGYQNDTASTFNSTDYQWENSTLTGSASVATDATASGGAYVQNLLASGDGATINHIDGGVGGVFQCTTTYADLVAATDDVYTNGCFTATINCPATGGWDGNAAYWQPFAGDLMLIAGPNNSVTIQRNASETGINLDKMAVTALPCESVEAEAGTLSGSVTGIGTDSAASSGKDVAGFNGTGNSDTLTINVPTAGSHQIWIRYAHPTAGTFSVYVNGTLAGDPNFPATSGWSGTGAWSFVYVNGTFTAGTNTIVLQRGSSDNAINFDLISVL